METTILSTAGNTSIFKAALEDALMGIAILQAIRDEADQIIDFEYVFVNKLGRSILGQDDLVSQRLRTVFHQHLTFFSEFL